MNAGQLTFQDFWNPEDVLEIAESIKCNVYTIQQFKNKVVADARLKDVPNPSREELLEIAEAVKPLVKRVKLITSEFGVEFIK